MVEKHHSHGVGSATLTTMTDKVVECSTPNVTSVTHYIYTLTSDTVDFS